MREGERAKDRQKERQRMSEKGKVVEFVLITVAILDNVHCMTKWLSLTDSGVHVWQTCLHKQKL